MKKLLVYFLSIALLSLLVMYALTLLLGTKGSAAELATVERGAVRTLSNVSGKVEAKETAKLRFPVSGTVREIYKKEGDMVEAGEIIASLAQDSLIADYNSALENLNYQKSLRNELLSGPSHEARAVSKTTVQIAEENLARAEREYTQIVDDARETLLTSNLEALPIWERNDDTPPTITGNYHCTQEGVYTLSIYSSNSHSGYSYKLSGLESGTFVASVDTPQPLGVCGLYIQFDPLERYRNAEWNITIPNTRDAAYPTHLNAYTLAVQQKEHALAALTQTLKLARETEAYENAYPTSDSLKQADARIAQAEAEVKVREARIADYVVKAPFAGMITNIDMRVGEIADTASRVSLIKEGTYELKVRIPEVDIKNIAIGDSATVVFDASPNEKIPAKIEFISPLSLEIDGVAYYEARLALSKDPIWIREGLNADIEIITEQKNNVLVIPKRFALFENDTWFVYIKSAETPLRTKLEIGLMGSDGFIEVTNLPLGTTLVMP